MRENSLPNKKRRAPVDNVLQFGMYSICKSIVLHKGLNTSAAVVLGADSKPMHPKSSTLVPCHVPQLLQARCKASTAAEAQQGEQLYAARYKASIAAG